MKRDNNWSWYGVKILYESIVSGDPNPKYIDENYLTEQRMLEESIIVVRAQSFEHAGKIATNKFVGRAEIEYENPYEEIIKCQFVSIIDVFHMFDDLIVSGTEIYSKHFTVQNDINNVEVIKQFYPEFNECDCSKPDINYRYRFMEYSKNRKK